MTAKQRRMKSNSLGSLPMSIIHTKETNNDLSIPSDEEEMDHLIAIVLQEIENTQIEGNETTHTHETQHESKTNTSINSKEVFKSPKRPASTHSMPPIPDRNGYIISFEKHGNQCENNTAHFPSQSKTPPPISKQIKWKKMPANPYITAILQLRKKLNEVDDNRDGKIDFKEFREAIGSIIKHMTHSNMQSIFKQIVWQDDGQNTHELKISTFIELVRYRNIDNIDRYQQLLNTMQSNNNVTRDLPLLEVTAKDLINKAFFDSDMIRGVSDEPHESGMDRILRILTEVNESGSGKIDVTDFKEAMDTLGVEFDSETLEVVYARFVAKQLKEKVRFLSLKNVKSKSAELSLQSSALVPLMDSPKGKVAPLLASSSNILPFGGPKRIDSSKSHGISLIINPETIGSSKSHGILIDSPIDSPSNAEDNEERKEMPFNPPRISISKREIKHTELIINDFIILLKKINNYQTLDAAQILKRAILPIAIRNNNKINKRRKKKFLSKSCREKKRSRRRSRGMSDNYGYGYGVMRAHSRPNLLDVSHSLTQQQFQQIGNKHFWRPSSTTANSNRRLISSKSNSNTIMTRENNSIIVIPALQQSLKEVDDDNNGMIDFNEFFEVLELLKSDISSHRMQASRIFYALADLKEHELDINSFIKKIRIVFEMNPKISGDECLQTIAQQKASYIFGHSRKSSANSSQSGSMTDGSGNFSRENNTVLSQVTAEFAAVQSPGSNTLDKEEFVDFLSTFEVKLRNAEFDAVWHHLTMNESELEMFDNDDTYSDTDTIHMHTNENADEMSIHLFMHYLYQANTDYPSYSAARTVHRVCRRIFKMSKMK